MLTPHPAPPHRPQSNFNTAMAALRINFTSFQGSGYGSGYQSFLAWAKQQLKRGKGVVEVAFIRGDPYTDCERERSRVLALCFAWHACSASMLVWMDGVCSQCGCCSAISWSSSSAAGAVRRLACAGCMSGAA